MIMTSPYAWLTTDLKNEIKLVFEPKYRRQLNEAEVIEIAENLTGFMETIIKWKMKHEQATTRKNTPPTKT
jgi:hypothetical protein